MSNQKSNSLNASPLKYHFNLMKGSASNRKKNLEQSSRPQLGLADFYDTHNGENSFKRPPLNTSKAIWNGRTSSMREAPHLHHRRTTCESCPRSLSSWWPQPVRQVEGRARKAPRQGDPSSPRTASRNRIGLLEVLFRGPRKHAWTFNLLPSRRNRTDQIFASCRPHTLNLRQTQIKLKVHLVLNLSWNCRPFVLNDYFRKLSLFFPHLNLLTAMLNLYIHTPSNAKSLHSQLFCVLYPPF